MMQESRADNTDFDASLFVCYLETVLFDVLVDLLDTVDCYGMQAS